MVKVNLLGREVQVAWERFFDATRLLLQAFARLESALSPKPSWTNETLNRWLFAERP